jgi:hypothetical protein
MAYNIQPIAHISKGGPTAFGFFNKISGAMYRSDPASTFSGYFFNNLLKIFDYF